MYVFVTMNITRESLLRSLTSQNTLREEILPGRNFGGSDHPPNPTQFGGIYFGGSRKKINVAGIYFGG